MDSIENQQPKPKRFLMAGALLLATALVGAASHMRYGRDDGYGKAHFASGQTRPVAFAGHLDRTAVLLGGDGLVRMELVIAAEERGGARPARVPTDLVMILDRSGSMAGEKIAHARAAIAELIGQLGPEDRFALVTYSNDATLAIPLSAADGGAREAWIRTVAAVAPDGGTNMARGLDLGLDTVDRLRGAGRVPHVILLSDGLANQGDASHEGLVGRAARAARGEYMLSTVGVGADFNEYLMTALADAGTGNYYYLESARDLGPVFAGELGAARSTVASGLAVTIEPADDVRVLDAAGYPLEARAGTVTFRPGSLFAGQVRRIWVTLAVPNHAPGEYALGRFVLSYTDGGKITTLDFGETPRVACVQDDKEFFAGVDGSTWTRSVVVEAFNKLQEDVARKVKEGKPEEAQRLMEVFRADTAAMNARVQSAPVAERLRALGYLEGEAAAASAAGTQNDFSKRKSFEAIDQRRAGSKH